MVLMRGTSTMAAPRKYSLELRERAVRMYRTSDPKPQIKKLAVDLGVHPEALRGWIRQAEADAGERDDRLTTDERAELVALRKENAQLKRANDVLRTARLFSRPSSTRPGPGDGAASPPGVEPVLRELHIASSTYYRWRHAEQEPCERVRHDADSPSRSRRSTPTPAASTAHRACTPSSNARASTSGANASSA